jgi:hypothetical protein
MMKMQVYTYKGQEVQPQLNECGLSLKLITIDGFRYRIKMGKKYKIIKEHELLIQLRLF